MVGHWSLEATLYSLVNYVPFTFESDSCKTKRKHTCLYGDVSINKPHLPLLETIYDIINLTSGGQFFKWNGSIKASVSTSLPVISAIQGSVGFRCWMNPIFWADKLPRV